MSNPIVEANKCREWHKAGRIWAFKCDDPEKLYLRVAGKYINPHKLARYISVAAIISTVFFSMSGFTLYALAIMLVGLLVNNLLINQLAAVLETGMSSINAQRDAMMPEVLAANALAPIIWELGKQFDPEGPEVDWTRVYGMVQLAKMVLAKYPQAKSIREHTGQAIGAIISKAHVQSMDDDELFRHIQYDLWQLHKTLDDNESEFIND